MELGNLFRQIQQIMLKPTQRPVGVCV